MYMEQWIKIENTISQMNLTNGHYKPTFKLKVQTKSISTGAQCHAG
jgi:hypothetical protein